MRLAGTTILLAAAAEYVQSLALALAEEGARVVLLVDDRKSGEGAVGAVRARGGACELFDREGAGEQVEQLADDAWAEFGPFSAVVFAPRPDVTRPLGGEGAFRVVDGELDLLRAALDRGLREPFFLARALASRMAQREGGAIVCVAGGSMRRPGGGARVLHAGLVAMTRGLGKVLPAGVRIAAVVGGSLESQAAAVASLLADRLMPTGTIVELGDA